MPDTGNFYAGQTVFDKKRTNPTDDLLVVVNPDVGTLAEMYDRDRELAETIEHNETNNHFGVNSDSRLIQAAYITHDDERGAVTIGEYTYTFPAERLATVESSSASALDGYYPYQWAVASFLAELVREVEAGFGELSVDHLHVLCMQARVDGTVITKATEWGQATDERHEIPSRHE